MTKKGPVMGLSATRDAMRAAGAEHWGRRGVSELFSLVDVVALVGSLVLLFGSVGWVLIYRDRADEKVFLLFWAVLIGGWAGVGLVRVVLAYRLRRRVVQRARRLESGGVGSRVCGRGVVEAAEQPRLPVVLRSGMGMGAQGILPDPDFPYADIEIQHFVIRTPTGSWLIDVPYVEVIGGSPSEDGLAAVLGEPLDAWVGSEVVVAGDGLEEATAPPWYEGDSKAAGYRRRTLQRVVGSVKQPIQIWVRSGSGRVVADEDLEEGDVPA